MTKHVQQEFGQRQSAIGLPKFINREKFIGFIEYLFVQILFSTLKVLILNHLPNSIIFHNLLLE